MLQANRDAYYEIATANSGTVKSDSAVDIDGAIFTLGQYAKWGDALGDVRALRDGDAAKLGKEPVFMSQHLQVPTRGVALFINAFNFPSWGLWEKAAPALLSGVPVIVKPARRPLQRQVAGREDVGMAGAEHQVDLGRPRPDALELGQRRDGLLGRQLGQWREIERCRRRSPRRCPRSVRYLPPESPAPRTASSLSFR